MNPALLFVAFLLTAASFWTCFTAVAHSRTFPARFSVDSYSLQALVESDVALARSASKGESGIDNRAGNADFGPVGAYSFCMTALRDIRSDSLPPLLRFNFAPPGASGAALIDGKIARTFQNEQRLSIRADVSAGNHWFIVRVDRPAETASIPSNGDFKYCPAR